VKNGKIRHGIQKKGIYAKKQIKSAGRLMILQKKIDFHFNTNLCSKKTLQQKLGQNDDRKYG